MPSKKKKKKNKNRDIDIIQTVQDSVQLELERLKNSTLALGQNVGDEKPVLIDKQRVKKEKKFKKNKSDKKLKSEETVDDSEKTDNRESAPEFKPYDYSSASQKLAEGEFN